MTETKTTEETQSKNQQGPTTAAAAARRLCQTWQDALAFAVSTGRHQLVSCAGVPLAADLTDENIKELFSTISGLVKAWQEQKRKVHAMQEQNEGNVESLQEVQEQLDNLRDTLAQLRFVEE